MASGVPEGEFDGSVVGVEGDGADFYSLGGDVFLFKFSGDVPLDEGSLAYTSVSDENDLEFSNRFGGLHLINANGCKLMPYKPTQKCSNKTSNLFFPFS